MSAVVFTGLGFLQATGSNIAFQSTFYHNCLFPVHIIILLCNT